MDVTPNKNKVGQDELAKDVIELKWKMNVRIVLGKEVMHVFSAFALEEEKIEILGKGIQVE